MQASAGFVSASALGMACGPALGGFLQTNFKIYKLTFNEDTLPGWVMAVAWLIYFGCVSHLKNLLMRLRRILYHRNLMLVCSFI